jgi:hypothetical protein
MAVVIMLDHARVRSFNFMPLERFRSLFA